MSQILRMAMMLLCAASLCGCASLLSTPYQPFGSGSAEGGYKEEKTGEGQYSIKCYGNGYTDYATLELHFHRRASELAKGHPYKFSSERAEETFKVENKVTKTVDEYKLPVVKGTITVQP